LVRLYVWDPTTRQSRPTHNIGHISLNIYE
jgi:hypothetical protein